LQCGLIQRTPRGRKATPEAYRHLGYKSLNLEQQSLF
jgi:Holliday junction resolvasome RuvABC ATP-dependent DNA helicase subunit